MTEPQTNAELLRIIREACDAAEIVAGHLGLDFNIPDFVPPEIDEDDDFDSEEDRRLRRDFDWRCAIAEPGADDCWRFDEKRRPTPERLHQRLQLLAAAADAPCSCTSLESSAFIGIAEVTMELGLRAPCRTTFDLQAKAALWRWVLHGEYGTFSFAVEEQARWLPVFLEDIRRIAGVEAAEDREAEAWALRGAA